MTRKELDDVLVEHKKWLEGKGGKGLIFQTRILRTAI